MILVTGSTGFLGKRLCKKLDMIGIEYADTSFSKGVDLREESVTLKLFEDVKPDYVLNCAAFRGNSQIYAEIFYNSMKIELSLLEACKKANVKRLVNPIINGTYPMEATVLKENEFYNGTLHESVRAYGITQKSFCVGSSAYNRQYGLDVINLVLPDLYGPGDHFDEETSFSVATLIKKLVDATENKLPTVTVYADEAHIREFMHVDDACDAMIKSMYIPSRNDILNVGKNQGFSIRDVASLVKNIVEYKGDLTFDSTKSNGIPCRVIDGTLFNEISGWKPQIDLNNGITNTIQWYKDNRNV